MLDIRRKQRVQTPGPNASLPPASSFRTARIANHVLGVARVNDWCPIYFLAIVQSVAHGSIDLLGSADVFDLPVPGLVTVFAVPVSPNAGSES